VNTLRIASHQGFEDIPVSRVTLVDFIPIGAFVTAEAVHAEKNDAEDILSFVDFEKPFVTDDVPGSIITGILTITIEKSDKETCIRSFKVLGSSLLQDEIFPNTYYYASPELYNRLTVLRQNSLNSLKKPIE
jgi:hypothetical protein